MYVFPLCSIILLVSSLVGEIDLFGNRALLAQMSGTLAGGLASILHCDKFRSFFSAGARLKCISNDGFFLNIKTILGEPHIEELYKKVVALHGSTKNLPRSCTSSYLDPSLFFFPEYVIQHIWTPLFVINSAYDSWQINNSLVPDILQERHKCMLTKSNANSPMYIPN
ncbi:pectin acetylesterase 8-like isoform X1 [Nicotiana tomentosiformis]|uniref:pectin acetylesterase 8-like isoform X1 n=1 Tax=Nicotiana tomentosiformis TaxID=4098 RepID=UPI000878AC5B